MDQSQTDCCRDKRALEFKSWCPTGHGILGLIQAALVSEVTARPGGSGL